VARQELRGAQLVASEAHHRGRGHRHLRPDLAKTCGLRAERLELGVDRRDDQVDLILEADTEQCVDEFRAVATRHPEGAIGDLAGGRHSRVQIRPDHGQLDAERRGAVAEAPDQLDPPSGRGDQNGAFALHRAPPAQRPARRIG
jgi:hypothetical protein